MPSRNLLFLQSWGNYDMNHEVIRIGASLDGCWGTQLRGSIVDSISKHRVLNVHWRTPPIVDYQNVLGAKLLACRLCNHRTWKSECLLSSNLYQPKQYPLEYTIGRSLVGRLIAAEPHTFWPITNHWYELSTLYIIYFLYINNFQPCTIILYCITRLLYSNALDHTMAFC